MTPQILIVDADPGAAESTSALVRHVVPGAAVVCEATPQRGWSAAQRTPPSLLLIDPAPYAAAGFLLIQLCKESWPATPVVVLASAPLSRVRLQQSYADVYLEKPASPAQLLDTLHQVLSRATAESADDAEPVQAASRLAPVMAIR